MKNKTSRDNFWDGFPLISGLVIAAAILIHLACVFDPNRASDHSFFNLLTPTLNEVRNGRYSGLLTSSLVDTRILFLVWGVGWIWFFGKTVENHVSIFFYIFLVTSSIIFPELLQILIFEGTGYGLGGIIYTLFGFVWFMSVHEPLNWSLSYREKLSAIAFIFLCILVDYTGVYKVSIGGLIGGVLWGVFVGLVSRSIKSTVLRFSILIFVLGAFFIPVFWAPWQNSWLLNEAGKYEEQNKFEEAKELYFKVLKKDPQNEDGKEGLINILNHDVERSYKQKKYKEAKDALDEILKIDPSNEEAKERLKVVRTSELGDEAEQHYNQEEYEQARHALIKLLEIDPSNQEARESLEVIPNKPE